MKIPPAVVETGISRGTISIKGVCGLYNPQLRERRILKVSVVHQDYVFPGTGISYLEYPTLVVFM